jgi:hypothetical protein
MHALQTYNCSSAQICLNKAVTDLKLKFSGGAAYSADTYTYPDYFVIGSSVYNRLDRVEGSCFRLGDKDDISQPVEVSLGEAGFVDCPECQILGSVGPDLKMLV